MDLTQANPESRKMSKPSAVKHLRQSEQKIFCHYVPDFRWVARMNAVTTPSKPKNFAFPVYWLCYAMATTIKSPTAVAQVTRDNIESEERGRLQQLLDEYGQNKSLPAGFELEAQLTLSQYPELKNRVHSFPH